MSKPKNAKYVPVKQSNTMTYVLGGIAVLVVIVVVIGGVLLVSKNSDKPSDQVASKLNAATPTFVLGKDDAPTKVTFFEDPYCPACASLENQYGAKITAAIEAGKVQARYFMVNFLDRNSPSGDYSDRAVGAMLAISRSSLPDDQKQKALMGAHTVMYAQQPEEGKGDKTNAEMATMFAGGAKSLGVDLPADVTAAITEGKYTADGKSSASENFSLMTSIGSQGTPTVVHDGKIVDLKGDDLANLLK
ncbi:DsbA family protein [Tsukamurella pseudospumae]|uniref:DsbA family protein n=1 Tax=Tsukamurella pseudospumae TaxID=239498 RepID=UPI0011119B7C|nr:thioredoxin domain-containing protein [Tsukamurella pseudospumae]